jgi:hypothetical protein
LGLCHPRSRAQNLGINHLIFMVIWCRRRGFMAWSAAGQGRGHPRALGRLSDVGHAAGQRRVRPGYGYIAPRGLLRRSGNRAFACPVMSWGRVDAARMHSLRRLQRHTKEGGEVSYRFGCAPACVQLCARPRNDRPAPLCVPHSSPPRTARQACGVAPPSEPASPAKILKRQPALHA